MESPNPVADDPKPKPASWLRRPKTALLLLAILLSIPAYLFASGPAVYAVRRGWLSDGGYLKAFGQVEPLIARTPFWGGYMEYRQWWIQLGVRHHGVTPPAEDASSD